MINPTVSRGMGSNLAGGLGFIGLEELRANLAKFYAKISQEGMQAALRAGALVYARAIAAATPIGKREYTYQRNGKTYRIKSRRPIGQARANVIIYPRRNKYVVFLNDLLVGYAKKEAHYMYWYEYGRAGQGAKPFMRPIFQANQEEAMRAAVDALKPYVENPLGATA